MITYIKGRLCEKTPTSVVIETNGIGYIININNGEQYASRRVSTVVYRCLLDTSPSPRDRG